MLLLKKTHVVHLAKRLEEYPYCQPRGKIKSWISVGRLTEKKGHLDAIRAFYATFGDSDSVLRIIGVGDQHGSLQEYINENKLGHRVTLLGSQSNREVTRFVSESDAFILCSKTAHDGDSEGTPTVLLEAQALGLPCISTWHSGIPEVIPEENHWLLADEGNVEEIADRIKALADCTVQQLASISTAGRLKIEEEFNLSIETQKLLNLYEEYMAIL